MMLAYGLAGMLLGILAGVLPGLGTGTMMILMIVPLMIADPISIILFYLGVLTSAQYFGSVAGILTGVPGDPSALPSSTWGFKEFQQGRGLSLLYTTAKWSLVSGLVSFAVFTLIIYHGWYWAKSLSTVFIAGLLMAAIAGIAVFSQNSLLKNITLLIAGLFLGSIGYSENFQDYFLSGPNSMLKDGIPWLPVMIGLLAVPSILYMLKNSQSASVALSNNSLYHDDNNYSAVAARGGIVGFLLGTVPGLSYILSSIAAAKVEEKLSADPRKIVVASEAANNAGAIGMLLPLFTLGIPITASESVLFVLLTTNTSTQNLSLIFQTHWIDIITYFVLINVVLFVLAWLCSSYINSFISSRLKLLAISSLLLAVSGTLYFGYWSQNLAMTCVVLVVFSIVGSQFRRLDWSPLVYSLIMYPYIESTLYKIQQIYF